MTGLSKAIAQTNDGPNIYSNDLFGTLSIDLLTKKIITNSLNLPINFDYRLQYIQREIFLKSLNLPFRILQ
jgi:hypothetical protein